MRWQKIKQLRKIKLDQSEKANIRNFLRVRISNDERYIYHKSFSHFNLFNKKNMLAGILAIILLMTGGGTTFAAESALPGDILYPIKIEVNEKVFSALALNQEKKADWSARQAERRLEEAVKLTENGKLNSENSAFLANKLKKHLDKTNELIDKLEEKGNIQAASRVSAHLKYLLLAHSADETDDTATSTIPTATTTPNIITTASTTASTSTSDIEDEDENNWKKNGKLNWGKLQKEIRSHLASSTTWEANLKDKFSTSTAKSFDKDKHQENSTSTKKISDNDDNENNNKPDKTEHKSKNSKR